MQNGVHISLARVFTSSQVGLGDTQFLSFRRKESEIAGGRCTRDLLLHVTLRYGILGKPLLRIFHRFSRYFSTIFACFLKIQYITIEYISVLFWIISSRICNVYSWKRKAKILVVVFVHGRRCFDNVRLSLGPDPENHRKNLWNNETSAAIDLIASRDTLLTAWSAETDNPVEEEEKMRLSRSVATLKGLRWLRNRRDLDINSL